MNLEQQYDLDLGHPPRALHGASESDLAPALDSPRFEPEALRRLKAANFKRGPEWSIPRPGPFAGAVMAIALVMGLWVGWGVTSQGASADSPGCGAGGNSPSVYQQYAGIFDCGTAPAGHPNPDRFYGNRRAEYNKCVIRVDLLDGVAGNNKPIPSSAWFAFYGGSASGANAGASTYCRGDGISAENLGEAFCADWQTDGPGTGPGINPAADQAECRKNALDAFFSGSFNPTQIGVPVQCDPVGYCRQSGDSNPSNRR